MAIKDQLQILDSLAETSGTSDPFQVLYILTVKLQKQKDLTSLLQKVRTIIML